MRRRGIGDRVVVALLLAAVVATLAVQFAWWRRRPLALPPQPDIPPPTATANTSPLPPPVSAEAVGPATAPIVAAAVSSRGRLVVTLDDSGEVIVWDVRARAQLAKFASEVRPSMPDRIGRPIAVEEASGPGVRGPVVAIGTDDGNVGVWHAQTGKRMLAASHSGRDVASDDARTAPVVDAELTAKGRLVTVSGNGSMAFWIEGQPAGDLSLAGMSRGLGGVVHDVEFEPAGDGMAVATDSGVYLAEIREDEGRSARRWTVLDRRSDAAPRTIRFAPSGYPRMAAVWSDGEIRVYQTETGKVEDRQRLTGKLSGRPLLALRGYGSPAATTDGDRSVLITWGESGPVDTLAVPDARGPIQSMWISADGEHVIVSTRGDRSLRSMPMPPSPGSRPRPIPPPGTPPRKAPR